MTTEKMTKELFDALEALCLMWNQYCQKPTGHLFMTAGEECMEILEKHKLLISEDDINGEIDHAKLEEYREQVTYEIEKHKYFAEMKTKQEGLYKTPKERDTPDLLKLTFELSARAAMQPHNQLMHDFYTEARVELESRLFENAGQQVKEEGWISCAERLPELGERVYAYDSDWGSQFVAYLNIANVWKMASDSSPINRNITHWHKLLSTLSLPFPSKPTTNAQ